MYETITTLNKIPTGTSVVVSDLLIDGTMRRRLQDIGMVEGTPIECIQKSPLGDPVAYLIKGAVIALRIEETKKILVRG